MTAIDFAAIGLWAAASEGLSFCAPLLAAGDFGWVIMAIILFVGWIFKQINQANEEAKKKQQTPPQNRPAQNRPAQAQGRPRNQQQARQQERQQQRRVGTQPPSAPAAATPPETVAAHVRKHLDTQGFEDRTSGLGQLSQLDDTVDEHLAEVFGSEVATEETPAAGEAGVDASVVAAAAGVAELFANPNSIRNAIILQEVLRTPKWD